MVKNFKSDFINNNTNLHIVLIFYIFLSRYKISCAKNGVFTLTPYAETSFSDKWIFENEALLEKVKQHLKTEGIDVSL